MNANRLIIVGVAAAVSCLSAFANTITFVTPSGSTESGGNVVNAEAIVTTGAGTVSVQLLNLLGASDVKDVAQNISDFSFTLSGTFASGLVSNTNEGTPTGTLVNVSTTKAVTVDTTDTVGKWTFSNTGSTFLLEDLGGPVGPAQTIIGGAGATSYPNSNGSINTSMSHNPFVQGSETFTLTFAGVTSATNITSAVFSFGTTVGDTVQGSPVPEPRTTAIMFAGALLMALAFRRRKTVAE